MTLDIARIEEYIRQQSDALQARMDPNEGGGNITDENSQYNASDVIDKSQLDEMRRLANKWVEMEDNVRRMKRMINTYNNMRSEYEEQMVDLMKKLDIDAVNAKDSHIQCVTTTRKKRVTKEKMKLELERLIPDAEVRQNILKIVLNEQPDMTTPKITLKRTQMM